MKKLDGRKLDHQTLEDIRIQAVQAVQAGMHPEDVVRAFGLVKRCIYNWLAAYRAGGYGQLKAKQLFGRPMKLSPAQIAWLYRTVAGTRPLQYRFEFALWTIRLVQWLIDPDYPFVQPGESASSGGSSSSSASGGSSGEAGTGGTQP